MKTERFRGDRRSVEVVLCTTALQEPLTVKQQKDPAYSVVLTQRGVLHVITEARRA